MNLFLLQWLLNGSIYQSNLCGRNLIKILSAWLQAVADLGGEPLEHRLLLPSTITKKYKTKEHQNSFKTTFYDFLGIIFSFF
mgnify:CR=1 FL=1